MCVLLGYGADAICPYLIFDAAQRLRDEGILNPHHTDDDIFRVIFLLNYFYSYLIINYILIDISELCGCDGERYLQSDGQDGHLYSAILQRSADL